VLNYRSPGEGAALLLMALFSQTGLWSFQGWVETGVLVEVQVCLFGLDRVLVDNTPVEVDLDVPD
jgi:hypothetical protein